MILSRESMQALEARTIARGIAAEVLMETAGAKLARCITQFHPRPGLLVCYTGKGHNAGDAFVAARHLSAAGWRVLVRSACDLADLAPLSREKFDLLRPAVLRGPFQPSVPQEGPLVQLDALVGLGARGPLREPLASLAVEMNTLRREAGAHTVAVDFPSGLDPDTGTPGDPCVTADLTATIGFAKTGLVADDATNHVGRLAVLEMPDFVAEEHGGSEVLTATALRRQWPPRAFDTNKGMCGRVVILAGSRGTLGAAYFATAGAVRGGAGLVSLGALPDAYELLATTVMPEVMVRPFKQLTDVFTLPVDAIGIGPGLGTGSEARTLRIVREAPCPTVVDADAPRPSQRPSSAYPASRRNDAFAGRQKNQRPRRGGARIHRPASGDLAAQRSTHGYRGERAVTALQYDGESRHGHRRNGRCAHRRLQCAAWSGCGRVSRRVDRRVGLRACRGDRHRARRSVGGIAGAGRCAGQSRPRLRLAARGGFLKK
jgi:NAD(P)H-hydrate epimerase